MTADVLILPGYGNSNEQHWQSLWEKNNPSFKRVNQTNWNEPNCADWVNTLETTLINASPDTKIVAHSLGCLLLAAWVAQTNITITGALLVAVPDPLGNNFPQKALGFSPITEVKFPFPSVIVASTNDPYSSINFAKKTAKSWGSTFIELGDYGHINSESGLCDWPDGMQLLNDL